jgi:hypothetical protein
LARQARYARTKVNERADERGFAQRLTRRMQICAPPNVQRGRAGEIAKECRSQ